MKKLLMLIMVMCSAYQSLFGQQIPLADLPPKVKSDTLAKRILNIDLEINKCYWDTYLQTRKSAYCQSIPVFAFKGFIPSKLYDSVPSLKRLNTIFNKKDSILLSILMKDRDYRKARTNGSKATSNEDKEKYKNAIYQVYEKLSKNKDYAKARKERDDALTSQNIAIITIFARLFPVATRDIPVDAHNELYRYKRDQRKMPANRYATKAT